ncbi:MAG: hypothetical protein GF334_09930 [Candidatus Altiarchaeales archaeon]|nr:hypothetical protein [Candidatus Altiarchaeales archaeon]
MVDYKNAFSAEEKVIQLLQKSRKLKKYKLVLHESDKYGVDVEATAAGYEDFAIEIESTQGSKWPSSAPWPTTWKKGFSVPARKHKFFLRHPMSLFVKVNRDLTRAGVVPMSYVFSAEEDGYENQTSSHFTCNNFYVITDPEHPALCFCKMEDLPDVVDEHFKHMAQLKRVNAKFTDKRPKFRTKAKKEN